MKSAGVYLKNLALFQVLIEQPGSGNMARNYIIGDIHAMYDKLISTLSSAGFRPGEDNLYAVGDFCDRGPNPVEVLEYLMSLPHFFPVVGNHDMWLYEYLCGNGPAPIWLDPRNGGKTTYDILKDLNPDKKARIRDWYGSFPFIRTVKEFIILHAGPPCSVADGETLIRLTQGLTLADAFKARQETGSYSPLIHGIVWDRDYIRSAIGWEKFSGSEEANTLCRKPFDTDKSIICGHTPLEKVFRRIFDSEEEMVAYKTRIHREAVENSRENPVSPSDTER